MELKQEVFMDSNKPKDFDAHEKKENKKEEKKECM